MIQGEGAANSVSCRDASFVDGKITHDISFYKDVIKRLKEELEKIKSENEQLRETVVAYSLKLPQVSRKLNTLVTCLEAKVYKRNRRKKLKSNDEAGDSHSSIASSLDGEEDGACDELQGEISEEEVSQTTQAPTNAGAHHSVQNFVEVICEEENSVGDAIITTGFTNNEVSEHGHPKEDNKSTSGDAAVNNIKSSLTKARTTSPMYQKSQKLERANFSKVKQVKDVIVKKAAKRKKSVVHSKRHTQDVVEERNGASKDSKPPTKSVLPDEGVGEVVTKIKMEETQDAALESEVADNSKRSKFETKVQESAISVESTRRVVAGLDSNVNDNTPDICRRGRRRAYDCEVCGRTFARSSNLAHHVMRHRNERPHQCEICDRAFVQKANLKVHLRSHTGERPFSCPECGRAFAQKNNALRHLRAHVRQRQLQEQKLVCPVCSKTFGRWPSYETHMRRVHANSESNSVVQMSQCIGDGMANESHPNDGPPHVREMPVVNPHAVSSIPGGNPMNNSQVAGDSPAIDHVHPSNVSLVNVHTNDDINHGPMPTTHHPQSDHIVVGNNLATQLGVAHGCSDGTC